MSTVWNTPLTPLAFLRRSADVYPDKTAIVYGTRRVTYADFAAEATRVAHALRGSGVERGDRVAYLLPNIPEMLVAHFAVPLAGAVLVAINTRLSTEEVRYILDHSGAKVLVVDAALHATVAPVAGELKTVEEIITVIDPANPGDGVGSGVRYDDLLARGNDEPLPWTVDDEDATLSQPASVNVTALINEIGFTTMGATELTLTGNQAKKSQHYLPWSTADKKEKAAELNEKAAAKVLEENDGVITLDPMEIRTAIVKVSRN